MYYHLVHFSSLGKTYQFVFIFKDIQNQKRHGFLYIANS